MNGENYGGYSLTMSYSHAGRMLYTTDMFWGATQNEVAGCIRPAGRSLGTTGLYLSFYPSCAVCKIEHSALVLEGHVVNVAMYSPFLFLCPTTISSNQVVNLAPNLCICCKFLLLM